ncbi:hypothetical protein LE181_01875 [Streptomyces sp. SCA3-4]|uniref:hypothetical protein n=1 Tax=Streptomyces sichuanensis TaxID=2871810 RepID=UPI001CE233D1|nr:hypothetical protein [Streptomyces sichuanensis]MCA6090923.1 hypothetical protein [Streptomyces sichuanensis]
MIEHLPPEAATMTALRNNAPPADLEAQAEDADPSRGRWSQTDLFLAQTIDAINRLTHYYTLVNTSGGKQQDPPQPVSRPGVPRTRDYRPRMSDATVQTLLQIINGHPGPPA